MNDTNITQADRLLVSVSEAARSLSIGRTRLYELLKSDDLESIQIGSRRLIKVESMKAFIERVSGDAR